MSVPPIFPPSGPTSPSPPGSTHTESPAAPSGEDHQAAGVILRGVVDCTVSFTERLSHLVNAHINTEAALSLRVLALNHEISRAVLRWVEQWPSTSDEVGP
jgi:hypothetical protein